MNERARRRYKESLIFIKAVLHSEKADPDSVGPEAYTAFGATFKEKEHKFTNIKTG